MLILILGDCHGRLDLVHQACAEARDLWGIDSAIQVGDFGFFPEIVARYLTDGPGRFPVPLHVIDGNHEDHGWLRKARDSGAVATWESANLLLHARGTATTMDGARIGFLGGALHADRPQEWSGHWKPTADGRLPPANRRRVPRDPAWANWVTAGDVERSLATFAAAPPDLLVTHSCPVGIGVGMAGSPALADDVARFVTSAGHRAGPLSDCGEGGLTDLWNRLPERPRHWVFGHFHRLRESHVDGTRFLCVGSSDDSDGVPGVRPALYDTTAKSLHVEPRLRIAGPAA